MNFLEKYLKNSTKRLTNLVCLALIVIMVISNCFGVAVDTTIFITLAGIITGNNVLGSWQANNSQFSTNDIRTIVNGYQLPNDENKG